MSLCAPPRPSIVAFLQSRGGRLDGKHLSKLDWFLGLMQTVGALLLLFLYTDEDTSGTLWRGTPYYTGLCYRAGPAGEADSLYSLLFTVPPVAIGWIIQSPHLEDNEGCCHVYEYG